MSFYIVSFAIICYNSLIPQLAYIFLDCVSFKFVFHFNLILISIFGERFIKPKMWLQGLILINIIR